MSLAYVIRRTVTRLVDLQVWDVAATMTFYSTLSLLPALVAMVSMVSLVGMADETVATGAQLIHELIPGVDPQVAASALLALANTSGGVLGVVLGLVGALISASNAVAAFHRAMHRIHDTREGRQFLWFRTVVALETLVLMLGMIATLTLVVIGGEFSERLGRVLGFTAESVATWNALKWPVILAILIFTVSLAYYRGPNVKLPHYRLMTAGGVVTVVLLFAATVILGWLAESFGAFDRVLGTLNGVITVLVLVWAGFIVLVAGAAFDAELLRARQLAAGLPAWDVLQLRTRHTGVLKFLDQQTVAVRTTARTVAEAAREDAPVTRPRTPWLAEADSLWAIDALDDDVSTGTPFMPRSLLGPDDDAASGATVEDGPSSGEGSSESDPTANSRTSRPHSDGSAGPTT